MDQHIQASESSWIKYAMNNDNDHANEILYTLSFLPIHLFCAEQTLFWSNQICDFILKNISFLNEVLSTTNDLSSDISIKLQPFTPNLTSDDVDNELDNFKCRELVESCLTIFKQQYLKTQSFLTKSNYPENYKNIVSFYIIIR